MYSWIHLHQAVGVVRDDLKRGAIGGHLRVQRLDLGLQHDIQGAACCGASRRGSRRTCGRRSCHRAGRTAAGRQGQRSGGDTGSCQEAFISAVCLTYCRKNRLFFVQFSPISPFRFETNTIEKVCFFLFFLYYLPLTSFYKQEACFSFSCKNAGSFPVFISSLFLYGRQLFQTSAAGADKKKPAATIQRASGKDLILRNRRRGSRG